MNKKLKFFSCIVFLTIFTINIDAAEGGPCKDYGDCDEFNYSLNDIESLQRGASTYLNYCYGHSNSLSKLMHLFEETQYHLMNN